MKRPLRPVDRFLRAPLGFAWFIVLLLVGVPVMLWMTALYYVSRLFVRGGSRTA